MREFQSKVVSVDAEIEKLCAEFGVLRVLRAVAAAFGAKRQWRQNRVEDLNAHMLHDIGYERRAEKPRDEIWFRRAPF